jgi:hypothetical protein
LRAAGILFDAERLSDLAETLRCRRTVSVLRRARRDDSLTCPEPLTQNAAEPEGAAVLGQPFLGSTSRSTPLRDLCALLCRTPISCDGRKIFAHKIAKMTKIWDQRIGASCRTDASMQARRDPSFPQRVRDMAEYSCPFGFGAAANPAKTDYLPSLLVASLALSKTSLRCTLPVRLSGSVAWQCGRTDRS